MVIHRFSAQVFIALGLLLSCCHGGLIAQTQSGQKLASTNALEYKIRAGSQRVTMNANSSKILTLDNAQIPRALVQNPDLVNAIAISPNQIQISGLKPGVTQLNLWDDSGELYSLDIVVYGDSRELELLLETEFPNASLRVRPLASSVVVSGWVDNPDEISRIVRMAEDYYPKVINNIRVGDNQQVMLHVQVMEVSRTKLRQLGVDWASFGADNFIATSVSGLIGETTSNAAQVLGTGASSLTFGLADGSSSFFGVVDALRQNDVVKVLAEPVLTTVSGRPAAFSAGGEFPVLIPQGLGAVGIEYKTFGTRVDFVPIVLGNGNIRLEVRPQVSEIDNARGVEIDGFKVPALVNRWVDTAVEMRAGQTLALAGLIQDRVESQNRGLPFLADLPYAGALFRRVVQTTNEVELLVMVRPEFVDAMDPHQVPMFGPGEQTTSPNDRELYMKGYLEVPACCPDGSCRKCRPGRGKFANPENYNNGIGADGQGMGMGATPMEIEYGPYGGGVPVEGAPMHGVPHSQGVPVNTMPMGMRQTPTRVSQQQARRNGAARKPANSFFQRIAAKSNRPGN